MKRKYMMLSTMISGPRQPENDRCLYKSSDRGFDVVMGWRHRGFRCIWKGQFHFASIVIFHD